jgi:hypothetical protein
MQYLFQRILIVYYRVQKSPALDVRLMVTELESRSQLTSPQISGNGSDPRPIVLSPLFHTTLL